MGLRDVLVILALQDDQTHRRNGGGSHQAVGFRKCQEVELLGRRFARCNTLEEDA